MTDTTKATPRPWRLGDRLPWMVCVDGRVIATTADSRTAASFNDDPERQIAHANAALIVEAVNEHDALLAVEQAARAIEG